MKKTDDKNLCWAARCTCASTVIYLGTPLCDRHWLALCAEQDEEETKDNG
jgi:hypothetical protein